MLVDTMMRRPKLTFFHQDAVPPINHRMHMSSLPKRPAAQPCCAALAQLHVAQQGATHTGTRDRLRVATRQCTCRPQAITCLTGTALTSTHLHGQLPTTQSVTMSAPSATADSIEVSRASINVNQLRCVCAMSLPCACVAVALAAGSCVSTHDCGGGAIPVHGMPGSACRRPGRTPFARLGRGGRQSTATRYSQPLCYARHVR